jgi:hypothetical protein
LTLCCQIDCWLITVRLLGLVYTASKSCDVSDRGTAVRRTPSNSQSFESNTPGRLLVIATPSGVERFFEQCAEPLPGPLDMEALAAITEANWSKSVGPPLGVSDPL